MEIRSIILHARDNVAVLAQRGQAGDTAMGPGGAIPLLEDIPTGHKMAIRPISKGDGIVKYGVVIGQASQDIAAGEWVHTHNVIDITEQICNTDAAQYRAKAREAREHGHDSGI